jgi:L-amino acid N-acyltransferase YncA
MENTMVIDDMKPEDWGRVRDIYLEGIATGHATFQKEAPSWKAWDSSHIQSCRVVARMDDKVVGWAALTPVSSRCVYSGVAEVSVYVDQSCAAKGIGTRLLHSLIMKSEKEGFWTLQSSLFPENTASLKLHLNHGFRVMGRREKIGQMDGVWRDTIILERRSKMVGC